MDGVLIDTEPVWRRVEIEVFGSVGVRLTDDDCRSTMGVRVDEVVGLWWQRRPWSGPGVEEVAARIVAGVADHVRTAGSAIPGAVEAVATVRAMGLRCAVASSSPEALIDAVLDRLALATEVDVTCSAEHEAHGKPAPDVYLRAASLLGVVPSQCLAVEDSVAGLESADSAGMRCVVIPDAGTAPDGSFDRAVARLLSISELDRPMLERLRGAYFP